jgi:uncharacterized DUF497 family protein
VRGYLFEWDPGKATSNLWKHGVCFQEAITVFADPFAVELSDPDHSISETRYLVLGTSDRQRLLVVAFVERTPRTRLISARRASARERSMYEEGRHT